MPEMIVNASGIHAAYHPPGQPKTLALRGADLFLGTGEVLGVLGRNGAGKTTLLRVILGLMHRSQGALEVVGFDPQEQRKRVLERVGAVLNGRRLLRDRWTPVDTFAYLGAAMGMDTQAAVRRGTELLERFGLEGADKTQLMRFSLGMKQKMVLAIALLNDPELLVLDEPTIGLDVESVRELSTLIREAADEGRGVIVTSHQLNLLERLSDRVVVIHKGKTIYEGAPEDLTARQAGVHMRVHFAKEGAAMTIAAEVKGVVVIGAQTLELPLDPEIVAEAMRIAHERGLMLSGVEQTSDFEDAFLGLTGEGELE